MQSLVQQTVFLRIVHPQVSDAASPIVRLTRTQDAKLLPTIERSAGRFVLGLLDRSSRGKPPGWVGGGSVLRNHCMHKLDHMLIVTGTCDSQ
jgi:hypothetical protein